MYIDADTIIKAASLLGAIGALVAAIVSVYKVIESNKKQSEFINAIQEEQTLICYGLRGASQEAALGVPVLFEVAVPALADARRRGLASREARLDTLFAIMAVLDDSNLAHRGGLLGLRHAQQVARDYLARGGSARPDGIEAAWRTHRDFVARHLSPGGAADTLAAACWIERVCRP